MSKTEIDKTIHKTGYRSDIDRFFHAFDEQRDQLPAARLKEVAAHKAIAERRDQAIAPADDGLWDAF